jgi:hypothetical protein
VPTALIFRLFAASVHEAELGRKMGAKSRALGHIWRAYREQGLSNQHGFCRILERAMGIEPTSEAWEASILPLNYARPVCERTDSIT